MREIYQSFGGKSAFIFKGEDKEPEYNQHLLRPTH
jgi:hypothetical protein